MSATSSHSKVYIKIVSELRNIIELDGLKPGDKIPSERELSERLNVGRSSVREALRSIELLGLIETKVGEGTFLKDFRNHQLVHILSTFILQDEQAKKDVQETKFLIEMNCLRLLLQRNNEEQIHHFKNWVKNTAFQDDEFFLTIVKLADNHLFLRIWLILKDYYNSLDFEKNKSSKEDYLKLVDAILTKDVEIINNCYSRLRNLSNL
ncbi:FadR/GntR family transcriptional regulator [Cytobacillus sp. Hz8]|uniref:FadR/GntR family transcriptional regulator n=1 Tax=Cytobacillus sp. Hz8 TaxID=3347168 RepID=UPI0035DC70EE